MQQNSFNRLVTPFDVYTDRGGYLEKEIFNIYLVGYSYLMMQQWLALTAAAAAAAAAESLLRTRASMTLTIK